VAAGAARWAGPKSQGSRGDFSHRPADGSSTV
jgi:hypothetical protein